ncbi:MAG: hypothetical protein QOE06_164 [Thermoleophilaceae bacterium]|jgi:hypothetical protein|nr:hypothetical protein [Thermoleophilaceae bacterium]
MDSGHARVTLDLELGSTPIQGTIDRGGGGRRFEGWIELASLIEAAAEVRVPEAESEPAELDLRGGPG